MNWQDYYRFSETIQLGLVTYNSSVMEGYRVFLQDLGKPQILNDSVTT